MGLLSHDQGGLRDIIINIVFAVLATVFIVLRFWAARLTKRSLKAHDAFVVFGWILGLGLSASLIVAIFKDGIGAHQDQISDRKAFADYTEKEYVAATCVWLAATFTVKLSVLLLTHHIFITKTFRTVNLIMMGVVGTWFLTFFTSVFLICLPFEGGNDPTVIGVERSSQKTYTIASAVTNMAIDLIIMVLPMPPLWKLQLPFAERIGLSIVFTHGLMICMINSLRIVYTVKANPNDASENFGLQSTFIVLEVFIGIATACQPCTAAVWKRLFALKSLHRFTSLFTDSSGPKPSRASGRASESANVHGSPTIAMGALDPGFEEKFGGKCFQVKELEDGDELPLQGQGPMDLEGGNATHVSSEDSVWHIEI